MVLFILFYPLEVYMIGEISRDEMRSAIEDKLSAYFATTSASATNDQVFSASAMVIREIMSRFLAVEDPRHAEQMLWLNHHWT